MKYTWGNFSHYRETGSNLLFLSRPTDPPSAQAVPASTVTLCWMLSLGRAFKRSQEIRQMLSQLAIQVESNVLFDQTLLKRRISMTLAVQERELRVYRFYFTNTFFFCLEFSTEFAITSYFFYLKILYTPPRHLSLNTWLESTDEWCSLIWSDSF